MKEKQLVLNSVECLNCGEVLISHHRHDFAKCDCENGTYCDGGTFYQRFGGKDLNKIKSLCVYADDDFEIVRVSAERGGRGINRDEPLTWTKLADMNIDWLKAVIEYGGSAWHIALIKKEIKYREINGKVV